MSGINSLNGLNKVSVDYRPQVGPDAPNAGNAPQPQQCEDIIQVDVAAPANTKLFRQLDTLLLNAASKSVAASAAEKMDEIGEKLHSNILTDEETEELDRLSKDATDKLKAVEMRLDEAIAHAKKLASQGKVYADEHWNNPFTLARMTDMKEEMTIVTADGTVKKVGKKAVKGVKDYLENSTPSYYKRDNMHMIFS